MSKHTLFLVAIAFVLGIAFCSTTHAQTTAQANLTMGSNYAKSENLDIEETKNVHVTINSGQGSQSHIRYDIELLKSLPLPGREPLLLPQVVKSDFVAPGQTATFEMSVNAGKYRVSLHSDEGNCEGTGSISYLIP